MESKKTSIAENIVKGYIATQKYPLAGNMENVSDRWVARGKSLAHIPVKHIGKVSFGLGLIAFGNTVIPEGDYRDFFTLFGSSNIGIATNLDVATLFAGTSAAIGLVMKSAYHYDSLTKPKKKEFLQKIDSLFVSGLIKDTALLPYDVYTSVTKGFTSVNAERNSLEQAAKDAFTKFVSNAPTFKRDKTSDKDMTGQMANHLASLSETSKDQLIEALESLAALFSERINSIENPTLYKLAHGAIDGVKEFAKSLKQGGEAIVNFLNSMKESYAFLGNWVIEKAANLNEMAIKVEQDLDYKYASEVVKEIKNTDLNDILMSAPQPINDKQPPPQPTQVTAAVTKLDALRMKRNAKPSTGHHPMRA